MSVLNGKYVLLTQPKPVVLPALLVDAGATYWHEPLIVTRARKLSLADRELCLHPESFDWLVFTSKNGVRYYFDLWSELPKPTHWPKIAAVGKATAAFLEKKGLVADYVNSGTTSHDMLADLQALLPANARLLALLGNLAPNRLADGLHMQHVQRVDVYETLANEAIDRIALWQKLQDSVFDAVVLTSPSAVELLWQISHETANLLRAKCVCIGTVTAEALRSRNIEPLAVATEPSEPGILKALYEAFEE